MAVSDEKTTMTTTLEAAATSRDIKGGSFSPAASTVEHAEGGTAKDTAKWVENGLVEREARFMATVSEKESSRIYRKVDLRVIPMLTALYLIAHLDRANLGNAKLEGLEKDLGMVGNDYNIAVSVFFIPYILFELPSNMVLARFKRPSLYLSILVTGWGVSVLGSGFTDSFAGLCVCRCLVGVFEAGFLPAAFWLISQWYPPYRAQSRTGIFYFAAATSGAFSGLLAAAIAQMDGLAGKEGWRWIFIIEGCLSVLLGLGAYFLLPDTPALSTSWLAPEEIRYLELVFRATRGRNAATGTGQEKPKKKVNWKALRAMLTDKNLYLQSMIAAGSSLPNNGMKYTLPQIVKNMGYTSTKAQLLSVPPFMAAGLMTIVSSFWVDKRRSKKLPLILLCQCMLLVGFSVLFALAPHIKDHIAVCYTFVVIACMGIYPIVPAASTWCINNLAGPEKRVASIGFFTTLANLGGFLGSWVFLNTESPAYPTGFGTCLSFAAVGIICSLTVEWTYKRHNKKWRAFRQLEEMGDRSPLFKYIL
ncbi:putative transporter [Cyphellophora attinorum]|uniref:Putative transporter n=1 Tax=Cyphellophora attinorum TaxID=1664694 RepID=A0A0N0NKV5_9EURO|nr:putative transporter [Phialophora attinorum]KPI38279.1 putative transporter [Phialophora attinorum]